MDHSAKEATVIRNDSTLFSAVWNRVIIMFWKDSTTDELIDKIEEDARQARRVLSKEYATLIHLSGVNRIPPSQEARKRLVEITTRPNSQLKAIAVVSESAGFGASVTRGVVTSLDRQAGDSKRQVFDSIEKASHWIAVRLGRNANWRDSLCKQVISIKSEQLKSL